VDDPDIREEWSVSVGDLLSTGAGGCRVHCPRLFVSQTSTATFVSVKAVETHMSHIFVKLGIASRHELAARVFEEGFVTPHDA
jgi:hypothetical protein